MSPVIASPAVSLAAPLLWVTGVERGLLLIGLSVALGGLAGRGLARNYKGTHPGPLPDPWVMPGSLLGLVASAALIVTALADPHLAADLAQPPVMGPRSAATLDIGIAEFACFCLIVLLERLGRSGFTVQLLLVVVLAESLRAHPEGLLPLAGALLTICHLLPAVLWIGMLAYVLRTAVAWRAEPAAAQALIRLYGNAAAWLFAVVVITGIASALLLVPLSSLLTTEYGIVLIIKSALVVVVAGLAVAGRVALSRSTAANGTGPARVTKVELATLAVVLMLTGLLTVITPPAKTVFGGKAALVHPSHLHYSASSAPGAALERQ
ncbi:MAG TPA: CopD family protein [Streptosporangiaceae bacterium]|nr:CopD family protein [Streptosporangiaceae bacterium]